MCQAELTLVMLVFCDDTLFDARMNVMDVLPKLLRHLVMTQMVPVMEPSVMRTKGAAK